MKKLLPFLAGAAVFLGHLAWRLLPAPSPPDGDWAALTAPLSQRVQGYLAGGGLWLGLSYALAAAFTAFALAEFRTNRRAAAAGAAGGAVLLGALYTAGCFLLGCCGSPMLAVYIGLLGAKGAGLAGPLVLGFTASSVIVGYFLLLKRRKRCSCGSASAGTADGK